MIAVCGCSKQTTTCGELPKVINTDHHQKPACAGCIGLRLRPRPHAVVEHSKSRRPQLPRVGAVSLDRTQKNPCTEGAGVSNAEKWGLRVQSSGAAASCLVNRGQLGKPRRARRWADIAQCLNGGYANGVTWLGTIHGQAAWIRLRLAVSSARNTRLEHAPSIGSSNKRPQPPRLGPFP
jgi:hypothetical protein